MSAGPASAGGGHALPAAAGLGGVALLGWVNLPMPFSGDQALFLHAASMLERGGTLYRDFWDNKQPGVFWFYELSGRLFGFSEVGVRLLELCYLLLGTALLLVLGRRWFSSPAMTAVAPVATFGTYYAAAGPWHLTQLEILVAPLLLLLIALVAPEGGPVTPRSFVFGVAATLVLVFKFILLPIPVAFWLLGAWWGRQAGELFPTMLRTRIAPALIGGCAALLPVIAVFWHSGALGELGWATFAYPVHAAQEATPAPTVRLVASFRWFGGFMAPWILFAAAAAIFLPGKPSRLTQLMLVWVGVGALCILLQRFSWWEYHFDLLIVPVGALGVLGLDHLTSRIAAPRWRRLAVALGAALAFTPAGTVAADKANRWRAIGFTLAPEAVRGYRASISPAYGALADEQVLLNGPDAIPGAVYVWGNPVYLLHSGRPVAVPLHGWSWRMFLRSQVEAAQRDLETAAPAYVFVSRPYARLLQKRFAATANWVLARYDPALEVHDGMWYRRKEGA